MDCVLLWDSDEDDFVPERVQRKFIRDTSDIMNLSENS